ncbi:LCP family protein [Bacillus suaedae]|uniref:Regulatory protein MsrR n=1 Tax=Halalkalibacter suaedae TaxID=2822140 RepID=A0A940X103_9BACI|nr:LCP family protein [Bacillus suaedae]MBP3953520.1 LCP family protein [Bacillus suaedae]
MPRKDRRMKKSRRRVIKIAGTLLILLFALVGYVFYQYYQGLQTAETLLDKNINLEPEEFNSAIPNELGKVNVLLLGVDKRSDEKASRTDTIMVAQYDPSTNDLKLASFMRDIQVEIPNYKNYRINTAYFLDGAELLRTTMKHNFDIDLHYYALVDFQGFEAAVDSLAPDGIKIDVEKAMSEKIGVSLQPGLQQLNGKELLGYARFRQDSRGDFARVERQQKVINALKDEVLSFVGISKIPKVVGTVQPFVETNLGNIEIIGLLSDFILNKPNDIQTLRIPVEDSYQEIRNDLGSVLEIDFDQNKQALREFLGE